MAAGPVGSVWASGTWSATCWEEDTWANATAPTETPPGGISEGGGAFSHVILAPVVPAPRRGRKRPRWAGITLHWAAAPLGTWSGTAQATAPTQQADTIATPARKGKRSMGLRPVLHVQQEPAWLRDWNAARVTTPKAPRRRARVRLRWQSQVPMPALVGEAVVVDDEAEALQAMFRVLTDYLVS